MRVWERPAEKILAGNIATLPLAPIASVSSAELPALIHEWRSGSKAKPTPRDRGLWAATYLLMGLVYPETLRRPSFKESET